MDLGKGVKDAKVRWSKVENGKGGEKDGMHEWVCGLQAGTNIEFVASWAVASRLPHFLALHVNRKMQLRPVFLSYTTT